jgi:hypothetical protein
MLSLLACEQFFGFLAFGFLDRFVYFLQLGWNIFWVIRSNILALGLPASQPAFGRFLENIRTAIL